MIMLADSEELLNSLSYENLYASANRLDATTESPATHRKLGEKSNDPLICTKWPSCENPRSSFLAYFFWQSLRVQA
jgi:hypothetical protein